MLLWDNSLNVLCALHGSTENVVSWKCIDKLYRELKITDHQSLACPKKGWPRPSKAELRY